MDFLATDENDDEQLGCALRDVFNALPLGNMVVVAPNLLFAAFAPVPLKDTLEIEPEGDNAA